VKRYYVNAESGSSRGSARAAADDMSSLVDRAVKIRVGLVLN